MASRVVVAVGIALSVAQPSGLPAPDSTSVLVPGAAVGPYTLVSRVRSIPSTFTPSSEVDLATRKESMALQRDVAAHWSSLLLPDSALLLDNATADASDGPSNPALPAPDRQGVPELPDAFEATLREGLGSSSAYRLRRRMQRGAHGEIWRGVRNDDASGVQFVLKRLLQGDCSEDCSSAALLAGLREKHFGVSLRGMPRIARYVDSFEIDGRSAARAQSPGWASGPL